jgi:chitinase
MICLLSTFWIISTISMGQSPSSTANAPAFRVVGYLPDYRASSVDSQSISQLTDLIVFSAEPKSDGQLDLKRLESMPWKMLKHWKTQHRLRLILCVGGWERSDQFAKIAADPKLRSAFVQSSIETCLKLRLDGIDLDWEHPKSQTEQQSYGSLLSELNAGFEPHGLCLSMTMAAWQEVPQQAFDALDWIQVMAYDHPGKHLTLENAIKDIERLKSAGAPTAKLVLGIPFYGRKVNDASQVKTYAELVQTQSIASPTDEVDGFYFNGPTTVTHKVEFAKNAGLAGVMIWEIGQDARNNKSLLQVIRKSVP